MTRSRALCRKCDKRRVDLFYATIAMGLDFSELCCCEVSPEFVQAAASGPVIVCKKCSKRLQDKHLDDSVRWAVRHAFCCCAEPERYKVDSAMADELVQRLEHQLKTKRRERPTKETEIQVEKRKFPIESFKPLKQLDSDGGRVFKCRDRQLGTLVSVKILKPQPDFLDHLKQEAEFVSELEHENILKLLDFGVIRGIYPCMVTEYADGDTLRNLIAKSGRLPIYTVVNIITQICNGLSHAHSKEVFHWNLTSNKILLKKDAPKASPVVKIVDFGLALNMVTEGAFQTEQGLTLVGTAGYMSPDQATGQEYDARSDIYSLGCIMFEMLTGQLPFKGETPEDVLVQQTERPAPKLSSINRREFPDGFSDELEKIVGRCLRKNKEDRYASVYQLKNAIKAYASRTSVTHKAPEPKWKTILREHKLAACSVLLVLLLGSGWATYSWLSSESAYDALSKSGLPMQSFLATTGSDHAKVELGRKYLDGIGVQQDTHKAKVLFSDAAARGFAPAQFWLGYCYLKGIARRHQNRTYANAVTSIAEATEGDEENYAQAYTLISQAAEKGYPAAEKYMGLLIRLGMDRSGKITPLTSKGRTQRLTDSASWLKKASDHGDPEATNYLGIEKAEEFGWSPNLYVGSFDYSDKWQQKKEEMFRLFKEAAQAGQPDAQYNMALCYELGVGTPANNDLAKKFYHIAAQSGVHDAQFRYGFLLELEKSPEAVDWYKKSADLNNLYAMIALCRCYSEGFCTPANRTQAQYWYVKVLEHPDRLVPVKGPATSSSELLQEQEKMISGMDQICKEHLEMPHLLLQRWGPSGIKCWPRGPMRDIDLIQISPIKDVTYLDLYGMRIHDRGAKFLPGLPLTMLRLVGQDLTRAGYSYIAKLNSLQGIELSGDAKTDGLNQLSNCRFLVFVGVTGLISQETIDQLAAIKSLKNIAFHCRKDVSLAKWGGLPLLESIRLDDVTQKTVNSLAAMKNLKALTIGSFKQQGPSEKIDLSPLSKLPRLEKLRFTHGFDEHIVNQLKSFKQLKNLSITSTKGIADDDLHLLRKIPAKEIEIFLDADCKITDKGLMILGSIPSVTHVNISVSPVTPGGVKAFQAKFPNHYVTYSTDPKGKKKDQVEDQVEKQIKKQIDDQIEKQIKEQEERNKKGPAKDDE